ncbi:MAG: hypothetical protein K8R90_01305 [Candidatus Cloacimonetes bacterium]|nr:hypothetical protein [Candidatus Cloacimonadota bacterium]
MFGNLTNRFVSTVASLTALVFSSYTGNDAAFSNLALQRQGDMLTVQCRLVSAFDHDFEEFFRSGKPVNVWFMLQVHSGREVVLEEFFYHRVEFDPMSSYFEIYLHDQQYTVSARSYAELIEVVSLFDHTISLLDIDHEQSLIVSVTGYLAEIRLDTMSEPFDLMLLWNFKRPVVRRSCILNELET